MSKNNSNPRITTNIGGLGVIFGNPWVMGFFVFLLYVLDLIFVEQSGARIQLPGLVEYDLFCVISYCVNPVSWGMWFMIQVGEAILFYVAIAWVIYIVTKVMRKPIPRETHLLQTMVIQTIVGIVWGGLASWADWESVTSMVSLLAAGGTLTSGLSAFLYYAVPTILLYGGEAGMLVNRQMRDFMLTLTNLEELSSDPDAILPWEAWMLKRSAPEQYLTPPIFMALYGRGFWWPSFHRGQNLGNSPLPEGSSEADKALVAQGWNYNGTNNSVPQWVIQSWVDAESEGGEA